MSDRDGCLRALKYPCSGVARSTVVASRSLRIEKSQRNKKYMLTDKFATHLLTAEPKIVLRLPQAGYQALPSTAARTHYRFDFADENAK